MATEKTIRVSISAGEQYPVFSMQRSPYADATEIPMSLWKRYKRAEQVWDRIQNEIEPLERAQTERAQAAYARRQAEREKPQSAQAIAAAEWASR
jgi:hypothetical protein